jgi:hypothetical protein
MSDDHKPGELTPDEFNSWIRLPSIELPEGYGMNHEVKDDDTPREQGSVTDIPVLEKLRTPHEVLIDLARALDANPNVQWQREHDRMHALYLETRVYLP